MVTSNKVVRMIEASPNTSTICNSEAVAKFSDIYFIAAITISSICKRG